MDSFITLPASKSEDAAPTGKASIDKDVALIVRALAEEEGSDISDYESKDKSIAHYYCVVI
jgi:hypothetical protein